MQKINLLTGLLAGLLAGSPASAAQMAVPRQASPSPVEDYIYRRINAYRESAGLPAVPRSRSLDRVAHVHVLDLAAWHPDRETDARGIPCNTHSWSSHGAWTPVCYTPDHAHAADMWNKPAQVTREAYPGNGYEIAVTTSGLTVDPDDALASWETSRAHNAVILEQGAWGSGHWQAMGVGVYQGYAVIWFGREPDRAGG